MDCINKRLESLIRNDDGEHGCFDSLGKEVIYRGGVVRLDAMKFTTARIRAIRRKSL